VPRLNLPGRLLVLRPEQPADAVGSLARERVGWVGVDARRGHLGVSQDALYHVDVYVQFSEERLITLWSRSASCPVTRQRVNAASTKQRPTCMKHSIWVLAAAAGILTVPACSHPTPTFTYAGVQTAAPQFSPAIGNAYRYNLSVRCGIDYAFFAGHWWQADKPLPAPSDAHGYPYAYGTMTLLSPSRAKFTWPGVPPVVTFHPTATRPPTTCD
jgi:hypothetical protein